MSTPDPTAEPTDTPRRHRALVLWADPDSPNLGVRVLAQGTAALIHECWNGADVVFHNYGMRRSQLPIGSIRGLLWERVSGRRGMQDWLRGFDVIIDTRSGDSFTDAYGLERHAVMCLVGIFAAQAGVPVVLGPQTIGPVRGRLARALARASLRSASAVFVRDPASRAVAAGLGRREVIETTDVVFALPVPEMAARHDVILNVSGLLWEPNTHIDSDHYRAVIRALHRRLVAEGRHVSLLAHVLDSGNGDSDVAVVRALGAELGAPVIVPSGLDDVRTVLAGSRLVIGSRMHACLNALSVGTPAVPLGYSDKFAPLLAELGWRHGVDLRDPDVGVAAIMTAIATAEGDSAPRVVRRALIARHSAEFALARLARGRLSRAHVAAALLAR